MAELPDHLGKPKVAVKRASAKKRTIRHKHLLLPPKREPLVLYSCPNPPSPGQPNGGEVVICSANEVVAVSSTPKLPGPGQPCYFHCGVLWTAPSGWLVMNDPFTFGYPSGNPVYGALGGPGSSSMGLKAPSSVSSGNAGLLTVLAEYTDCSAPYNTSGSSIVWVGGTGVSNGQVNSSPSIVPNYVPSGYATLSVQLTGGSDGGSTNWYIGTGSGSLYPSYNYCTATWSGFLRVVVDASNRCGSGGSWTFYLTTQQGYYGYRIAPNPAKEKVSLILDYKEMIGEVIQGITLYDSNNKAWFSSDANQLRSTVGDKNAIDIVTKNFPRGTYFLHVQYGIKGEKDAILKSQIILE